MLRKVLHTVFVIVLIGAATGISFSQHYCHGNFVSTKIGHSNHSCCGSRDCCHNESFHLELDNDFLLPETIDLKPIVHLDNVYSVSLSSEFQNGFFKNIEEKTTTDSSPPIKLQTHLAFLQTYLI